MIAIPNMEKPKSCTECNEQMINIVVDCYPDEYGEDRYGNKITCPLIEIDLVRCGECKWWNEETHGCDRNPSVKAWWRTDFCSYGERSEWK